MKTSTVIRAFSLESEEIGRFDPKLGRQDLLNIQSNESAAFESVSDAGAVLRVRANGVVR